MKRLHRRIAKEPPIHCLRAWRKYRRLTQQQLAERSNLSHSSISRLETGEMDLTRTTAAALSAALQIEIPDLFRDPTDPQGAWNLAQRFAAMTPDQRSMIERVITAMLFDQNGKLSSGNT